MNRLFFQWFVRYPVYFQFIWLLWFLNGSRVAFYRPFVCMPEIDPVVTCILGNAHGRPLVIPQYYFLSVGGMKHPPCNAVGVPVETVSIKFRGRIIAFD